MNKRGVAITVPQLRILRPKLGLGAVFLRVGGCSLGSAIVAADARARP
jgi:hypothetical protein